MKLKSNYSNDEIEEFVALLKSDSGLTSYSSDEIRIFEHELQEYFGKGEFVAVTNGTAALKVAFHLSEVKEGDHVLLPQFGYFSSILPALLARADIEFYDLDIDTLLPKVSEIRTKVRTDTKILLLTYLFGIPVNFLDKIELPKSLIVIEDCAQAMGMKIGEGFAGTLADYSCFSFQETKVLSTGEGGAIYSSRRDMSRARDYININSLMKNFSIKHVATPENGYPNLPVDNFGFDALRARLGRINLRKLDINIRARRRIARNYFDALNGLVGIKLYPSILKNTSSPHGFPILVRSLDEREKIIRKAKKNGILIRPLWPCVFWEYEFLKRYTPVDSVNQNSKKIADTNIFLPIHASLTDLDVKRIIEFVRGELAK